METLDEGDPKFLGNYQVLARIGFGGMGIVYLALGAGDLVALKTIRGGLNHDAKALARFEKEIASQRMVKSPFVAKVLDSDVGPTSAWIAMEYVAGVNLLDLLAPESALSDGLWWSVAMGCASALARTHKAGLIHRDLKPSNIIISSSGPKIVDFGIARSTEDTSVTVTGVIPGSPAWLAPEQLDDSSLTSAVDIFTLGAVLYFCAAGRSPWGRLGQSSASTFMKAISDKEPNFDDLDSDKVALLRPMLAKNPNDRPAALDIGSHIREIAGERLSHYFSWLEFHSLESD